MKKGPYVERYADLLALLIKASRTVKELCEVSEMEEKAVRRFLHALHAEGLLMRLPGEPDSLQPTRAKPSDLWVWAP